MGGVTRFVLRHVVAETLAALSGSRTESDSCELLCFRWSGCGVLAQLVNVSVWGTKVEPAMAIGTSLEVSHTRRFRLDQLSVRLFDVFDPEPGNRAGVEMLMLNGVRAKQLETIPVLESETGKPGHVGNDRQPQLLRKEISNRPSVIHCRSDPNDSLDLQNEPPL